MGVVNVLYLKCGDYLRVVMIKLKSGSQEATIGGRLLLASDRGTYVSVASVETLVAGGYVVILVIGGTVNFRMVVSEQ